ncbi:aminopeptidase P family protein [Aminobacter aganoensis]|uniref:Xaa-Pro aminopeptidase n=1 Tax=Aminobacter aganoensis TaxID=83264 RepID=A0A7X0F4J0_9HYPH|nr:MULTISPECIES: aminopeptidase P family protein [Aminobacter]KQU76325.1 X-Pro aminopeptidase [Aminobacter sp. DSM 101952]MBB6352957.1 Xaa-Pro aminopeptidase [Aminobacter aganoensis]
MFQSFDSAGDPSVGKPRTALLRQWLRVNGLDGFIVPRADEHQGEYVAARSNRLRWLTGFSGSAGVAIVLADSAYVFVDGRYTLQVRDEVDLGIFSIESLIENPPSAWIRDSLPAGARLGFDPWLHTIGDVKALSASAEKAGATLVPLARNPIDAIWEDQPDAPLAPVEIHPEALAGELAKDKLKRLAAAIDAEGATHAILTDPSSLAWAFNIRGGDVPHTPLALGFAILAADGAHAVFIDKRKLGRTEEAYLTQLADIKAPGKLDDAVTALAKAGARIALDPVLAADRLRALIEDNGGTVVASPDPARLPRATKNAAEIAGSRAAHRRDGAAVAKLLCWLDRQERGKLDEIAVVTRLEECRRQTGEETQMPLRDVSFDTISGAGPNGAIMHYRVSRATSRVLGDGELFLLDSGAQYQDGTTDITRTMPVGQPTEEMRERFTLVLKGMIAISVARFPAGTRGADIDAMARIALWKHGLDYAHGTGHGVGSYLAVHEGPQRIAKTGMEKLLAGMILSNEPGYYKEGHYGIRLENLILVTPTAAIPGGDIAMHGFETLTLAPFDQRLLRADLLTREELDWLNAYHARVLAEIGPMLDGETLAWLEKATAPIV